MSKYNDKSQVTTANDKAPLIMIKIALSIEVQPLML